MVAPRQAYSAQNEPTALVNPKILRNGTCPKERQRVQHLKSGPAVARFSLTFEVSTNEIFLDRPPRLPCRMGWREPRRTRTSYRHAEARPQSRRRVDRRHGFRRGLLRAPLPPDPLLSPSPCAPHPPLPP